MITNLYILDAKGEPCNAKDLFSWGEWMSRADRRVDRTVIGEAAISTVFLGMDHSLSIKPESPLLWETMVFGGDLDGEMLRCSGDRKNAEALHERMVLFVKANLGIKDKKTVRKTAPKIRRIRK